MNKKEIIDATVLATPCPASWAQMAGDEKKRFCGQCKLHVYNISEMSEDEAGTLLLSNQGKEEGVCLRFFRRADGTILTKNCPVGWQKMRERARQTAAWFAAGLSFMISLGAGAKDVSGEACGGKKPLFHGNIRAQQPGAAGASAAAAVAPPVVSNEGHWGGGKPMMKLPTQEEVVLLEAQLRSDESRWGATDSRLADQLVNIGNQYRMLGNNIKSRAALQRAITILDASKPANKFQLRNALYAYQALCQTTKDTVEADNAAKRLSALDKEETAQKQQK